MSENTAPKKMCSKAPAEYRPVCEEISDVCLEWANWPLQIMTDKGEYLAVDAGECMRLAWILAGKGHTLLSPKPSESHSGAEGAVPTGDGAAHPNPGVTPMRENDMRRGYCTERTGFLPISRATLLWIEGSHRLLVDGKPMDQGFDPIPILSQNIDRDGHRVIMLPYREVHFKLGKAKPVNKSKFRRTIGRMISDMKNVISGPFAKVCGLDYLKEFAGDITLYVVGRTDRLGTEERNIELSEARAKTVADAIDKRKGEMSKALWGGGKELRIKYIGIGEQGTVTADEVASPDDRRVELYFSTEGPPIFGPWVEIGGPADVADPSDYLEYYCGDADSDCKNVVAQCEASLKVMCGEAYPFSQVDRERCAARAGAWMALGEVADPEVKKWLDKGYFRFPIVWDRGLEFVDTLKRCLERAPAISNSKDVPHDAPSRLTPQRVTDAGAVRGKIPKGTSYCTAEHGWMESSRTMITETPRGEMLWYKGLPAAMFSRDWISIRRDARETMIVPVYEVDLDGGNVEEVSRRVANELLDFIAAGDFTRKCLDGEGKRVVLVEFWSDTAGIKIERRIREVVEAVQGFMDDHSESIPRGTAFMMRFNFIDPYGKHKGLFVSPSLPADYGHHKQQGIYGPTPKNGGDGEIEVIPLK